MRTRPLPVDASSGSLPWLLSALLLAYLVSVILLSYREGLSLIAKATGLALVAGVALHAVSSNRPLQFPVPFRLWGAWFIFALLTLGQASHPELAIQKALTVAQVLLVALVIFHWLAWHGVTRFYWMALAALGLASCAIVWTDPATFSDGDGRVFGPLGNANAFGAMLVTGFIMVLAAAFEPVSRLERLLWVAAAAIFFAMVLQTGSRQGLLGMFVALLIFGAALAYRARKGVLRSLLALSFVAALMSVGVLVAKTSEYWFRVEAAIAVSRGDTGDADSSMLDRIWLYKRAAELVREHPVAGVGLDNFRVQPRHTGGGPVGLYTHSNYMEVLASTGTIGFLLYFSAGIYMIGQLWRARHLAFGRAEFGPYLRVTAIVLTYLVMDVATVSYYDKFVWLVMPWIVAELQAMRRMQVVRVRSTAPSRASIRR